LALLHSGGADAQQPAAPAPAPAEPAAPATTTGLPAVPLAPPAIFPAELEDDNAERNAGIHAGRIFIRDSDDIFRFYPGVALRTDFYAAPGSPELPAGKDGNDLEPYFNVRRVRLNLQGELFERIAFQAEIDFLGSGRIGGSEYTGATTPRVVMPGIQANAVSPADVSISYRFREWLALTVGHFNVPFSMENRTRETVTTAMEKNMAIRSFVMSSERDLGLTVWGDLGDDFISYELGVVSGDGTRLPQDTPADYVGRAWTRPFGGLGDGAFFQLTQIGMSARYGDRDPEEVTYDYPNLSTNQGFVLWQPGYVDSLGRATHVIPSGPQRAIGGELRIPFELTDGLALDLRGEAYYVANDTREAVDGFQATNTERLGRVNGVGWYGLVSFWCCGDAFVSGEPGRYRPLHLDLHSSSAVKRGLEIFALASGVAANYSGAEREGVPDANTPSSNIAAYQFGGGVQFWWGWNFRAAINYFAYFVPDSGDPKANQAVVADNLVVDEETGALGTGHAHHEIGTRVAVTF
jgi:phosphate-selective porin OprO and OprP